MNQSRELTKDQILEYMRTESYKPLNIKELEAVFAICNAAEFKAFVKLLNQLEDSGEIVRTRTNNFGLPERMNLLRGRLQGHAKGFGFLIPDDESEMDVYIHEKDMKGAMNGDRVIVRPIYKSSGVRPEGEIIRILTRANTEIVGLYSGGEQYGFVMPDDKRISRDIFIPRGQMKGAVEGSKVVVHITKYPEGRKSCEGEIVEVLGHRNDPGVDILSIIRKYGLPEGFAEDVLAEALAVPSEVRAEDIVKRRDLRDQVIVTMDGEDAKDLDDAISIKRLPDQGYELGVHIADVTHYVKEGSGLDREAYERGTSVYLVDRVIPMLPQRLSNGICSLNPDEDRLTLSCVMRFDSQGTVKSHEIFKSVIRSHKRLTYNKVKAVLVDGDAAAIAEYAEYVDQLELMQELALKLRNKRMERGAIDFDFDEAKILVDEVGKPTDVLRIKRSIAEQIIEEFMLKANETVAEHYFWLNIPFLYRVHEDPEPEKLFAFAEFLSGLGYRVKGLTTNLHPRTLQGLLADIKDTPEETVISTLLLRSMKQARYNHEPLGHFGLSVKYYSHFTSPIRRYPDLQIHRVISNVLEKGELTSGRIEFLQGIMPVVAAHSSERERIAVEAERETDDLKKAEFMVDKIGEEFEGVISSVTSFGMFVELDNLVEGLVHVSYLTDDYYRYNEKLHALVGERTAKIYRIGDIVNVRVVKVNLDDYTIDFELVGLNNNKINKRSVNSCKQGENAANKSRKTAAGGTKSKKKSAKARVKPRKKGQRNNE